MPSSFADAQARIHARRAAHAATVSVHASSIANARTEKLLALPPTLRILAHQALSAWDSIISPFGIRPAFRVGQVDSELLDEELLSLLKNNAGEGLRLFGPHLKDDWQAEIGLVLRSILWKLSIWDHAASYGASLQGLKYIDARQRNVRIEASKLQRAAYGVLTVGGRYAWTRWEDHLSSIENNYDTEPSSLIQRLSRLTTFFSTTHNIAAFVSFLIFLYNGKYRTLTDRILRMRLVPSSNQTNREVSFEFLNRQLVWHAFTEFLLFLLPLVGISRWKRWLLRFWNKFKSTITNLRTGKSQSTDEDEDALQLPTGELSFLPERTCAICYQDQNPTTGRNEQDVISAGANTGIIGNPSTDITNPYETVECGCIYCFMCLARRIEGEEGEGWVCLRCGEVVKECKPWNGDVEEQVERPASARSGRKSIAWADELVEQQEFEKDLEKVEPMPVEDEESD